jgi:hypothetical protein
MSEYYNDIKYVLESMNNFILQRRKDVYKFILLTADLLN